MVKRLLLIVLVLSLISVPIYAASDVHDWYINVFIRDMNADREAWNKATTLAFIRKIVDEGFVTADDILKEFGGKPVSQATPTQSTATSVKPTNNYAALEILEYDKGYLLTRAGGHYYCISSEYDPREEVYTDVLMEDNKVVYRFDEEEYGITGLIQIKDTVYVATSDAIYKYSNKKLTKVTKSVPGYIHGFTTNGKDMYILCHDEPGRFGEYLEGKYYKVTTSGTITPIPGSIVPVDYSYRDFAVNKDGDRLARIPFEESGVRVRKIANGGEYSQRNNERYEFDTGYYTVDNLLYYNNCLIVNVKGSIVYYDENNVRHVILGDMKDDILCTEQYKCQPGDSLPIKTGLGDEVRIGYVSAWSIGDDGCIYGITREDWNTYHNFKLTLPDSIKSVTTYKKTK